MFLYIPVLIIHNIHNNFLITSMYNNENLAKNVKCHVEDESRF